ncbi:MAG: glycerol-3-phosphate dehydrogenase [Rhizobiales bacterium 65-9]|nr:NAD(P)-dependent glycerol-3-phosphate dehydrogenase [Hyphomicrobiales bacterium]OJY36508.1 MAG: glycerol-3-phosphate dehydrogenase [Rhizobiales bacterium 65-9]
MTAAADRIAVVGAGAWGTALANAVATDKREVFLIARDPSHAREMRDTRENRRRLPGVALANAITPTAELSAVADARLVILATPAQTIRAMTSALAPLMRPDAPILSCAKGIERETGLFPTEILGAAMASPVGVLSGPSFAADVARGLPTAIVLACADGACARALSEELSSRALRLYHGDDVRGVEIGGAAKNVLAIGAGVVAGRGLGESARAALVARGFAELQRFAAAFGGRPETLGGLSGLGDLVLSCCSTKSRNFSFGEALGRGQSAGEAARGGLAEGAFTADILVRLAAGRGVDLPISSAVAALVSGRMTVDEAVAALMARPLRAE